MEKKMKLNSEVWRSAVALTLALASSCAYARFAAEPECLHDGKVTDWWFGRFEMLRETARQEGKEIKIAFLGDSITENWFVSGRSPRGGMGCRTTFARGHFARIVRTHVRMP